MKENFFLIQVTPFPLKWEKKMVYKKFNWPLHELTIILKNL